MKKQWFFLATILLVAALVSGVSQNLFAQHKGHELTDSEKTNLLWMRESVKVARDMYQFQVDKWGLPVFKNKLAQEQANMDLMRNLVQHFGLIDPVVKNDPGAFSSENFRALYVELAMRGNANLPEALRAAALMEELDIMELEDAIQHVVTNPEIKTVYENMALRARNHLRGIIEQMQCMGEIYGPQRMPEKRFYDIVDSAPEGTPPQNK